MHYANPCININNSMHYAYLSMHIYCININNTLCISDILRTCKQYLLYQPDNWEHANNTFCINLTIATGKNNVDPDESIARPDYTNFYQFTN